MCSECDPKIGKWHGEFAKEVPHGWRQDTQGFIYSKLDETKYAHLGPFHDLIVE